MNNLLIQVKIHILLQLRLHNKQMLQENIFKIEERKSKITKDRKTKQKTYQKTMEKPLQLLLKTIKSSLDV